MPSALDELLADFVVQHPEHAPKPEPEPKPELPEPWRSYTKDGLRVFWDASDMGVARMLIAHYPDLTFFIPNQYWFRGEHVGGALRESEVMALFNPIADFLDSVDTSTGIPNSRIPAVLRFRHVVKSAAGRKRALTIAKGLRARR